MKLSGRDVSENLRSENASAKILIVDGDLDSLREIASVLRSAGYAVITTPSSSRGVQLVRKEAPDALVVSEKLKEFSGLEFCQIILDRLNVNIPVLFYSRDTSETAILQAYEAGIRDYLAKPAPAGLLRAKMKILLQEKTTTITPETPINDEMLAGESFFPSFKIIEKIGTGSTGHVYKAIHKITMEVVAIKVLHPQYVPNPRDIQRFFRGSLIGLELPQHPNIVRIMEIKRGDTRIFQVMELVNGRTLYDLVSSKYRLSEDEVVIVLEDISSALQHLERHQVLHRDVKPGNIFITRDWECKLGDLGISRRLVDRTATTTGHVVGTPGYLAPEQVLDIRPLDIRADLYSLGLTVFHAVTGENPYQAETAYKSMLARLEGPEMDIRPFLSDNQISEDLCIMLNKMLRRRASDRYDSPTDILELLQKYKKSRA